MDLHVLRLWQSTPDLEGLRHGLALRVRQSTAAVETRVRAASSHLDERLGRLASLSPLATLARGFALVTASDGRPATTANAVAPNDLVAIRWHDGIHTARIEASP